MGEEAEARASIATRIGIPEGRILTGRIPFAAEARDLTILPMSGARPHPTIVALHGMGMRPEPFARWFHALLDEPWAWLLPEGPYPMERKVGGLRSIGFAWYVWDGDTPAFRATLRRSEDRLLQILPERAAASGMDQSRLALLGFSQGGYLAGSLGLRHAERFRGVVIAGGRVRPAYAERAIDTIPRIPFLFLHGRGDEVVPAEQARESAEELRGHGFPVDFVETDGGHMWNAAMSEALREWIRRTIVEPS